MISPALDALARRLGSAAFTAAAVGAIALAVAEEANSTVRGACKPPAALTCEFLRDPQKAEISDPQPEFGWRCGVKDDAYEQSAYHIVVRRAAADGQRDGTVVWDSGRIDSAASINVEYAGELLQPGRQYEWQVQAWDASNRASDWSTPQRFRMARHLHAARTSTYPLETIPQKAVAVSTLGDGAQLADFGRHAFGYLKLRMQPSAELRTLKVRFGEKLSAGRIDREPGGTIRYYEVNVDIPAGVADATVRPPRDRRNTTGDAVRLPRSIGVVAPFRYVEVGGDDLDLHADDVIRIAVQYPFDRDASAFESSDPTLNAIWELCKYSIEATTFCGIYVDGDRERIPYEADAYINQLSHYGVDQEYALARRTHEYLLHNPTWPTEWKQQSILIAWADYMYTGNSESLVEHYDLLRRDKLLLAAESPNGLLDTSDGYRDIVDWPEPERDDHEMRPVNTVVNAFHYATLVRMSQIAEVVRRTSDAKLIQRKARRFHESFNSELWSDENQAYVDGIGSRHSSIHSNLFPLAFDLVPEERVEAVVEFLKSRGMACSVYAAQFLLEGLYQHDRSDYAMQLLTSDGKRSWVNMLRSGSTITLEAWDEQYKPNLDWNHAWGAAPANLIPFYVAGVRPLKPGFRELIIQPRPSDLKWFSSRVPTIRGPVEVEYRRNGRAVHLEVAIPGNSRATVAMPLSLGEEVIALAMNGQEVPVAIRGEHAWVENVPPGVHVLEGTFAPAITQAASAPSSDG